MSSLLCDPQAEASRIDGLGRLEGRGFSVHEIASRSETKNCNARFRPPWDRYISSVQAQSGERGRDFAASLELRVAATRFQRGPTPSEVKSLAIRGFETTAALLTFTFFRRVNLKLLTRLVILKLQSIFTPVTTFSEKS